MILRVVKILTLLVLSAGFVLSIIFFFNPHSLIYLYIGDDQKSIWLETKYIPVRKKVVSADSLISNDAQWSPNDKYFSYFDFVRLEWAEKEWALKIIDARSFKIKTIFIGDYHTGAYEWMDDNTVRVCAGAGSGVRRCRSIDIHVKQPIIAVDDYSSGNWMPEKTF